MSTLAVVTVGVGAFAAASLAPRQRRQWVFGWGTALMAVIVLVGLGWIIASAGFIIF